MTLSLAWVRKIGATPESIFASDSRLNGGGNVDHSQKVFSLPRENCCISFAGSTMIAYPFILQLQNTILEYKRLLDRALDLHDLRGKVLALLNRFIGAHEEAVPDDFQADLLTTSFLFGGWSWKQSRFYIWRLFYDPAAGRYVASGPAASHQLGLDQADPVELAHIGDYRPDFMQQLRLLLVDKIAEAQINGASVILDYEPLAALANMLIDPKYTNRKSELKGLIGGGPQVMKVYPYLRTLTTPSNGITKASLDTFCGAGLLRTLKFLLSPELIRLLARSGGRFAVKRATRPWQLTPPGLATTKISLPL